MRKRMILLFTLALLAISLDGRFLNSPMVHLSDILRMKCDALPYRTYFRGTQCYFAVNQEVKLENATATCASIFSGAQVSLAAPMVIFNAMMLDKSKFHVGKDSSGSSFKSSSAKQTLCFYDSKYTCDKGEPSPIFPGKCLSRPGQTMTFENAIKYCARRGMEVPTISNDLENRMIIGVLGKNLVWIHNIFRGESNRKWDRISYFGRFSTCHRPRPGRMDLFAGHQMKELCGWQPMSSLIDKTTYWANDGQRANDYEVLCGKNADNEFTPGRLPCIAQHKWDEESGLCEWTGPKDACVQLIDHTNATFFMMLPNFPKETHKLTNMLNTPMCDRISKAIVRRGCMFTAYAHAVDYHYPDNEELMAGNNNNAYGEHNVPCYYTGDIDNPHAGITRASCFCDPTEATLNDHEWSPPAKKKCIEHHVFDETTQTCEWKHDPKFCGELITNDGRRQMIEIPNWPMNRKYDANHWDNMTLREENFHITITEVIVRQHCWASLFHSNLNSRQTLPTAGYGKHSVISYYYGQLGQPHDGTHRIICECIR